MLQHRGGSDAVATSNCLCDGGPSHRSWMVAVCGEHPAHMMKPMALLTNPTFNDAVVIYSEHVDELAMFYIEVLGLTEQHTPRFHAEPGHSHWLKAGDLTLLLHAPEGNLRPPFGASCDSIMLQLSCDDPPAEIRQRAAAMRVEAVEGQPGNEGWLIIRDLEGRRLGVLARG